MKHLLIPEFESWLDIALERYMLRNNNKSLTFRSTPDTTSQTLWHCFALGAPLCVLLDLLGATADRHIIKSLLLEELVENFVDRIQLLELQGRLPYGEVLRAEDLFGGTHQGFAKVLRIVERILVALQATYPGLYILPPGSHFIRKNYMEEMIGSERAHMEILVTMAESARALEKRYGADGMVVECLATYLDRLIQYHEHVLLHLAQTLTCPHLPEDWNRIFSFDNDVLRATALGALRSYCVHYLTATGFLEKWLSCDNHSSISAVHIKILLDHISEPLHRVSDHQRLLQNVLEYTNPVDCETYDSLCLALQRTSDITEEIDEMGLQMRSMKSIAPLQLRLDSWDLIRDDPDQLGSLLLDDLLLADVSSGLHCSVFLFDTVLVCCQDSFSHVSSDMRSFKPCYPIAKWEFGPAMNEHQPLEVLFTIPTNLFKSVRRVSAGAFEIDWDIENTQHTHSFTALFYAQCDQWYSCLQALVPQQTSIDPNIDVAVLLASGSYEAELSYDENNFGGRRQAHPKPWSLIGRKGSRSVSSSVIRQEYNDDGLPSSPNMLPRLFHDAPDTMIRSPSPSGLSLRSIFSFPKGDTDALNPPEPFSSSRSEASATPLDLTGSVVREGKYPCAHGGFADVWKGIWSDRSGHRKKVAIKVLRSHTDDPSTDSKMRKRLRRELCVWQRLKHENVLTLHGTVLNFGHYPAFVCPWLEKGSIGKYLEQQGDVLSMVDRLQLLCEVAAGLSYLHASDVIHGDLTSSNILISDDGKACLCDFGLSSIAAEFQGTSYLTSTIGGSVRWAAPELYHIPDDESIPMITTHSDIYSYGSVTLEVLSGHVPFSYLLRDAQVVMEVFKGVKPRRPTAPFVTNQLWVFINQCWAEEPTARPGIEEVLKCMHGFLKGNRRNTS